MFRRFILAAFVAAAAFAQAGAQAQSERQPPYWVSLQANDALMRSGPAQTYPAQWRYVRRGLPMRVVATQPNWRKVQDPLGAQGWIMVRLLSDQRTALVTGAEPRPMHAQADEASPVRFRAEPGVVGNIEGCEAGWCELDVQGRRGFIRAGHIWGIDPNETVD
jgi:SH3-like domain-containing protein